MRVKIFSVYDSKSEAYMQPFFSPTKGSAVRSFIDSIQDHNTIFCKHPEDYTLFEIGEFDDSTGILITLTTPISLGLALEYVKKDMQLVS